MAETIQGRIDDITFSNRENGYTIARATSEGRQLTVVGPLCSPIPGEVLRMEGHWVNHKVYGRQFQVSSFESVAPASLDGLERYLASGLIKGLGPEMAARIVEQFGDDTLTVLENEPERLKEISGIGKKRLRMIMASWQDSREIRNVMIFLNSCGVSSTLAAKLYNHYGYMTVSLITQNPYRIALEVDGAGFLTADKIARSLGFDTNSVERASAGILFVLNQLASEGHVYYPYGPLVARCTNILDTDATIVSDALEDLVARENVVIEDGEHVYLKSLHVCETGVVMALNELLVHPKAVPASRTANAKEEVLNNLRITLGQKQEEALECALINGVCIISGGPGTGKTTLTSVIIDVFSRTGAVIKLAAPTGRAAKRMSEATGYDAFTIHRMLEYSMNEGFRKDGDSPIECDLLIVDEASMIDTVLMYHLLGALPPDSRIVFVGDSDQLPSVGPGNVLGDIIGSGRVPVVMLDEIFRQAASSSIVTNAHDINNGKMPSLEIDPEGQDFYFVRRRGSEHVLDAIVSMVSENIPASFGLDPVDDIQVISPVHKGEEGVDNLNSLLQESLNPQGKVVKINQKDFRVADKVMQLKNDYQKDVFNGDIGRIISIDEKSRMLTVDFDGMLVDYEFSEIDELTLAYAITVHKSQGSEYPAVVMPVIGRHYMMLQRNLIYTAITRGKRLVVMVGTHDALERAVMNNKPSKRYTRLGMRLNEDI